MTLFTWLFGQIAMTVIAVSVSILSLASLVAGIGSAVRIKTAETADHIQHKRNIVKAVVFIILGVIGITAAAVMLLICVFSHDLLSGRIDV